MLEPMFGNPPAVPGVPIVVIVLGIAVVSFAVGTVWLWRITHAHEDPDGRAERYRDRFN